MAGFVVVMIIVGIFVSMGAGMYMYSQYQTNYITAVEGDIITVGPVEYVITFEGTHNGSEEIRPENTFVMIGITAKNITNEKTLLTGGQFYIVDERDQKHEAIYGEGEFSSKDLFIEWLEPNKPIEITTQFDIPFDEESLYKIIVRPQKEQSTTDTAVVCITNC
jgi:hypothetical protein